MMGELHLIEPPSKQSVGDFLREMAEQGDLEEKCLIVKIREEPFTLTMGWVNMSPMEAMVYSDAAHRLIMTKMGF